MLKWKRQSQKRILEETDYKRLFQKICEEAGFINMDAQDLEILRQGEAAFIWESPPVLSAEEMRTMARQAALEMAPEPGQVILGTVAYLAAGPEWDLETIEQIMEQIHQGLNGDGNAGCMVIFSVGFCGEEDGESPHFVLATAEKRADGKEKTQ